MWRRPGSLVGALFVANAAFNNLGFPTWSTVFNWGRATVGTVPFVWIGATQFGAAGVIAGQAAGAVLFGDRRGRRVLHGDRDGSPRIQRAPQPEEVADGRAAGPAVLLRQGRDRDRLGRPGRTIDAK